jgi:hypothetical protein
METPFVLSWFLGINFVSVAVQMHVSEPFSSNGRFLVKLFRLSAIMSQYQNTENITIKRLHGRALHRCL